MRTTNQMLALARAKDASLAEGGFAPEPVDLVDTADAVIRALLPAARTRQLDVGMDTPSGPVKVPAADWLLREAVSNLVDNAIRYSPQGGDLTVRVLVGDGTAWLVVEDSGGHVGRGHRPRLRAFPPGSGGQEQAGRRPGLAIVGTIAEILGAKLVLENRTPQPGLRAALVFTLENTADAALRHENHRI